MLAVLFVHAFAIMGIYGLFSDGMLLGKIGNIIRLKVGDFWSKPLVDCPPCMASFWGLFPMLAINGFDWMLIPYTLSLSGLLYVFARIGFVE
jgi:hypothetical protein